MGSVLKTLCYGHRTTIIHPHLSQGEAVSVDTFQPSLVQSEKVEMQSVKVVFYF